LVCEENIALGVGCGPFGEIEPTGKLLEFGARSDEGRLSGDEVAVEK
jgi:hypothetical protein